MMVELIRHGQTILQAEHRYVGATDDPLSADGAHELVAVSAEACPGRVFVSALQRTSQTARIVFPTANLTVVPGLEEMDFGAYETHRADDLENDPGYRAWVEGNCEGRCPGGESKEEFSARVCAAFSGLLDGAPQTPLTVVAHSGTIMAVMERFGRPTRGFFDWYVPWGCGLLLDADDWQRSHTLKLVRHTSHRREDLCP